MAFLSNIVKQNRLLYSVYYYVGTALVLFLKLFLKPDSRLIVFNSFGGRKYDDSPQTIYLQMIEDVRFLDYRFVWAFINPDKFEIPVGKKVKIDTFSYYKAILKARVWVTNTTMTRALNFSGINTFSLNTWHGSAIKKIGQDAIGDDIFVSKGQRRLDIYLAQSEYDQKVFSHAFNINKDYIKIIGLPRNDELSKSYTEQDKEAIRNKLSIPRGKRVILYAPTYREYERDGVDCVLNLPISLEKWRNRLGEEYVLLLRAHHAIVKSLNIVENEFVKDVSDYPHLNELMIVSDILISDYSSIFFDYAILEKPMLCFAYDYEIYKKERGVYFDIRYELGKEIIDTEDKLINAITEMNIDEAIAICVRFRSKYVQKFGTATAASLDLIYQSIQ